jgi:predicted nuclease of predicted toxin-antitoxin system
MKFLIDAQLPRRLAGWLNEAGHDAMHTLDLPKGNRTPDQDINDISISQKRVVITKDEEFVTRFLLRREPFKLLLISTGNIDNRTLETLLVPRIQRIDSIFQSHDFVELNRTGLVIHI